MLTDIKKLLKYQMSRKSIQWEPSCSTWMYRQTDRQTDSQTDKQIDRQSDMMKLIEDFPNFTKTSKKTFRPLSLCL